MNLPQGIRLALVLALSAGWLAAQDPFRGGVRDLPSHPLTVKGLTVTIQQLSGHRSFDRERRFAGRARVEFTLENTGSGFLRFEPQDLSFVGRDGVQVFPVYQRNLADDTPPLVVRLAPGARASMEYALTGRLVFPARLYFGEVLVAEVTD